MPVERSFHTENVPLNVHQPSDYFSDDYAPLGEDQLFHFREWLPEDNVKFLLNLNCFQLLLI